MHLDHVLIDEVFHQMLLFHSPLIALHSIQILYQDLHHLYPKKYIIRPLLRIINVNLQDENFHMVEKCE